VKLAEDGSPGPLGDPVKDEAINAKISPVNNVERISVPVMIKVADKDGSYEDTKKVVANLRSRNVPIEYVVLSDEGHNEYRVKNKIRAEAARVEFFVKYLLRE
jgi:dipeptidyl aminopeptidase/acylaminoacyl peptidase